jgi:tRNA threonylcarbamoyladenosine dehydratase
MQVADISKTKGDPLARAVREQLKKRGIMKARVKCVFSPEHPHKGSIFEIPHSKQQKYKRSYYGTMSYMPAVLGMHAAAHVIRQVANRRAGSSSVNASEPQPERYEMMNPELEGYVYVI